MKQKDICNFQEYETIRSFGDNICAGKIDIDKTEIDQSNLLKNTVEFKDMPRPKRDAYDACALYEGKELILNTFRSGTLSIKETQGKKWKN